MNIDYLVYKDVAHLVNDDYEVCHILFDFQLDK